MPNISAPDIQKFQIFPRKHASGLPIVSLGESDKLTDFSFFFLCSLSLSFFFPMFFFGGGGGSFPLIWVTRGRGQKNEKNSYEEEGHYVLQELPVESHQPPLHR